MTSADKAHPKRTTTDRTVDHNPAERKAPAPRTPTPAHSAPPQTVLVQIRALLPSLPPAERRVAEAALADPANVAAQTITELAAECRTSETTVMRFCRTLGLKGYPDLRIGLASAASAEESSAGRTAVGPDIGPRDTLADIVAKLGFADARAVEDTVGQLDLHALKRAVEALSSADGIDAYGVGASGLVALDLQQKLHRIGRRINAWVDPHMALTSAALLRGGDVAIGISHTGDTAATVEVLSEAHRNGAITVAITNFPRSAITEYADHVLTTAVRETTFRSGAMASRIAALTVVDCLFVGVAQRSRPRTLRALERTYAAVRSHRL
ncbi:MurR/RpiR family transcriptional regulator [Kitasatospora paranensis]|uniref:MurR/RpiR family transcriptional regulator n=1 Tax=Kitasatospora paranensis TaxID=258053 RepID=A0ABW2G0X3_9ACTN